MLRPILLSSLIAIGSAASSCSAVGQSNLCNVACASSCRGYAPYYGPGCLDDSTCANPPSGATLCTCGTAPAPTTRTPTRPTTRVPTRVPTRAAVPTTAQPSVKATAKPTVRPSTATIPSIQGYWLWYSTAAPPSGTNLISTLSGYVDPATMLQYAQWDAAPLSQGGLQFIGFGGGDTYVTAASLANLDTAVSAGQFSAYQGITYDIEIGASGLYPALAASFANTRKNNLKVLFSTSYTQPYCIDSSGSSSCSSSGNGGDVAGAKALMTSVLSNPNVNYISPQLYTNGCETTADFTVGSGALPWTAYSGIQAAVVPCITVASQYPSVQSSFQQFNVNTQGYLQWSNPGSCPSG